MNCRSRTWGGRFKGDTDKFLLEFGASIEVDIELLEADIIGSTAWVKALGKAGVLESGEVDSIIRGLAQVGKEIRAELENGSFVFDHSLEDIHMTVEARLTTLIGAAGEKLHTGRSRNDQVALDERLYLKKRLDNLVKLVSEFQNAVISRAEEHIDTIAPSYTHLQQAQPVRLGHYLMAWFWMLERDKQRFVDCLSRADKMPLGSGAVAGSGFPVDREFLASILGFSAPSENSIDSVSDRDFILETLSASSILMMHLSRISEDLIIWSSAEFGFVELADSYTTGSSMMPQKKNPDSLELVRGKTGRVYGNLFALLTVLKGIPFSYCKDMQEDKEPLFDSLRTVEGSLMVIKGVVETLEFDRQKLQNSMDKSVFATDIADYLALKGMPFRKAHEVVGGLVKECIEGNITLDSLPFETYRNSSGLFEKDLYEIFDFSKSADRRNVIGGTGKEALKEQIQKAKTVLGKRQTG